MFTPAGGKSRAGARANRMHARGVGEGQGALPGVGGPPSYSYGSPGSRAPSVVGSRSNADSIAGAFNAAIRESEYSVRLATADIEEEAPDSGSTRHQRTPRGKLLAPEDMEASINRRRSLRSSSRSIGRASPSIISDRDYDERQTIDDETHLSFDYDKTQSSTEEVEQDDDALLDQLGMPMKESQFGEPHFFPQDCLPANGAQASNLHHGKTRLATTVHVLQNFVHKTRNSFSLRDWKTLTVLLILLSAPVLMILPSISNAIFSQATRPWYRPEAARPPETSAEVGRRLVLVEGAVLQLQDFFDTFAKQQELALLDQHKHSLDIGSLELKSTAVDSGLQQVLNKIDELQKRLANSDVSQEATATSLKQLQASLAALEKRFDLQEVELSNYIRNGGQFQQDLSKLRAEVIEHGQALQVFTLQDDAPGSLHERIVHTLDAALPARMPVLTKQSGELSISPAFWKEIHAVLSKESRDFSRDNREDLRDQINEAVQNYLQDNTNSNLMPKEKFLAVLKDELVMLNASFHNRFEHLSSSSKVALNLAQEASNKVQALAQLPEKDGSSSSSTDDALNHLVSEAVLRHSIDVIGRPDFAAYTAGGRINPFLTSPTYMHDPTSGMSALVARALPGIGASRSHPPAIAIHPSTRIGMCWAFPGHVGSLAVKLSQPVALSDVVIEHVHPDIAHDATSAPRHIEIWAHAADGDDLQSFSNPQTPKSAPADGFMHVMDVEYNVYNGRHAAQVFPVPARLQPSKAMVDQVLFQVQSNWGHPNYTCIYRVRAIGTTALQGGKDFIQDDESL